MMPGFSHLERCGDLEERDIVAASQSEEACAALLSRLESISAPDTGAESVLGLFGRLAARTTGCEWFEGELCVELFEEDDDTTRVRVTSALGGGLRERILPPIALHARLGELTDAVERAPQVLGTLRMDRVSTRCVLLRADDDALEELGVDISETCLTPVPPAPAAGADLDGGWD